MIRSDFNYIKKQREGVNFLLIIDEDLGNMSVTNDIENVISTIKAVTDIKDHVILYRDSNGEWDGWNDEAKDFFFLAADSAEEAMDSYIKRRQHV